MLELVRRREAKKREQIEVSKKIYEKRYDCRDFTGQLVTDILSNLARNARWARGLNQVVLPKNRANFLILLQTRLCASVLKPAPLTAVGPAPPIAVVIS